MVIGRRRKFVIVGAGLLWPAATLAPAATCWVDRPARLSPPGRPTKWGSWPSGWREYGSPVPGGQAWRANVRRMRFTVTSSWAGLGCAAATGGRQIAEPTPCRAGCDASLCAARPVRTRFRLSRWVRPTGAARVFGPQEQEGPPGRAFLYYGPGGEGPGPLVLGLSHC
jgi:hypothetical protein